MQAGHADVGDPRRLDAVGRQRVAHSSATGRSAVPAVTTRTRSGRGAPAATRAWCLAVRRPGCGRAPRLACSGVGPGQQHGCRAGVEQLGDDGRALLRGLARAVHRLGHSLAQRPVVVDPGEAEIGVGQAAQRRDGVVGRDRAGAHVVEQPPDGCLVHVTILLRRDRRRRFRSVGRTRCGSAFSGRRARSPSRRCSPSPTSPRASSSIGFDPRRARGHVERRGRPRLRPIENAIEGTVNVTLDTLAFEHDLLIQREVVIPVR